ncbi:MAG: hypothetical protein H0X29_09785, partial [Parachlamydiaceae bacterium]|nr:hypothetical protein [Parachlamydiaceae bacterium]
MGQLRISTVEETPLQTSKWLKVQVLLDADEMRNLCDSLGEFHFFLCGSVSNQGEGELSKEIFIEHYHNYISALKQGKLPEQASYRQWFSPVMTHSTDALYAILIGETKQLIRVASPVVQLQAHHMGYSDVDGKFRPMVFGSDSIPWGIQFSFPQLFRDDATKEVKQVRNSSEFPNSQLFQALQKWMRAHTVPTPFV